jgi:tRNA pseudouridine38-40 synthase
MPCFRLTLAYDGTDFAGSQVQPNQRTVQGELERALATIADDSARTVFAGRTDRGVHAKGQVASARLPSWRGTEDALWRALRANLPADLAAVEVARCSEGFNPRFDAAWREYRYWIAPGANDPFLRRYAWETRGEVSAEAVAAGARELVGRHDFATFAGGGEGVPWSERARSARGTVRTILRCECRELAVHAGPGAEADKCILEVRVAADGFLPQMVRTIVGALFEVGQGRQEPEWVGHLLAARDRRLGPSIAPARGLTLWKVGFAGDVLDDW